MDETFKSLTPTLQLRCLGLAMQESAVSRGRAGTICERTLFACYPLMSDHGTQRHEVALW